ncbi:MAG: hypothetical protein K6E98_01875 [Lachnospiraceae bacterium]|nr:hypothetical protein [Lachnospiraceae bacterium]
MKKITGYFTRIPFTIIISLMIISFFAGYIFSGEVVFSESENRYLAKRPEISLSGILSGSFMEQYELYIKERLPLRDGFIKLKALCGQAQFKNENNGIVCGKDGYLFERMIRVSEQLERNKAAINNYAKQTDRDMKVCIIPNSFEILTDKTPAGFENISEKKEIEDLYSGLSGLANVRTVDMYDTLKDHKDEYIYYHTDHHWTTLGAYYGYLKLCKEMGLTAVGMEELKDKELTVNDFYGTYYSKYKGANVKADTITYYDIEVDSYTAGENQYPTLYDEEKLKVYDKYAMFMHGNEGLGVVKAVRDDRQRKPELILFKDSYSNCLIPFLTYNYDSIYVVDLRYYSGKVLQLMEEYPDADILLMYNFMHFNEDNHFYRLVN